MTLTTVSTTVLYCDVRGCVLAGVEQLYTGNLLTVVGYWHTIGLRTASRIYSLAVEMADSI